MKILEVVEKHTLPIVIFICILVALLFFTKNFTGIESTEEKPRDNESEIAEFLMQLEGVGNCDVQIFTEQTRSSGFSSSENEKVCGIAVICDGGGDIKVKDTVTDILVRLYGLSGSRISVNERAK